MPEHDLSRRIQQLEDRAALKELVDTFSNLADEKRVEEQVLLFTEDATVESYSNGQQTSSLKGRQQIAEAFSRFLGLFDTVYHINGQQTVDINEDSATGVAYCLVVLIGSDDGKMIRTTAGVTYQDTYRREGGRWLIASRTSDFVWRSRDEADA